MSEQARSIYVIRHGIRQDFVDKAWKQTALRPSDPPLSQEGLAQARDCASFFRDKPISGIYASPFLRTVQSAFPTSEALTLPICLELGLAEHNNPDWFPEGYDLIPLPTLKEDYPTVDDNYSSLVTPGRESSVEETFARSAQAIDAIIDNHAGDAIIVSHGWAVQGMVMHLAGCQREAVNVHCCGINELRQTADGWTLGYCDSRHLSVTEQTIRFN